MVFLWFSYGFPMIIAISALMIPHLDEVLQMLQHVIWLHHQRLVIFLLTVVVDLPQEIHVLLTLHSLEK